MCVSVRVEGENAFDFGQEYKEFRWAEVVGLPLPLTLAQVQ